MLLPCVGYRDKQQMAYGNSVAIGWTFTLFFRLMVFYFFVMWRFKMERRDSIW